MSDQTRLITSATFRNEVKRGAKAADFAGTSIFKAGSMRRQRASPPGAADEPERREISFVLSNASVDREGDSIAVEGWNLDPYRQNPCVLFSHQHDILPIGKALEVGVVRQESLRAGRVHGRKV